METLREVRLYGPLRRQFGRSHWLAVDSPAEAVRALAVLHPGFREAVLGFKGVGYRVWVGEGELVDVRDERSLDMRAGPDRVIRIAPVLHGRKSGLGSIILGAALFFIAPYAAGALYTAGASVSTVGTFLNMAQLVSKGLMLGGLIQLVSPQRKENGSPAKNEASYIFNGAVNVSSPGGPVPLLIGRMIVGSVEVSGGLSTDEVAATTTVNTPPTLPSWEPYDPRDGGQGY